MPNILRNNAPLRNRGLTSALRKLKADLRRARISGWQIAQATGVTDTYVWMVLNGRRRSQRILETATRLLAAARKG